MTTRLTMTVPETAKALGISEKVAYEAVRAGRIPTISFSSRLLVPVKALEEVLLREALQDDEPGTQPGPVEERRRLTSANGG